jgi:putative LysE/RhtB family amino acid efflux pump
VINVLRDGSCESPRLRSKLTARRLDVAAPSQPNGGGDPGAEQHALEPLDHLAARPFVQAAGGVARDQFDLERATRDVVGSDESTCTLASVLVVIGYGLGLLLAAQVGPVTLLIVRSVLRGGRALAVGLAMAAAVVVIDLGYAVVGLAGVGSVFSGGSLRLWFGLVSAAVLIGIGMRTLWIGWRARVGLELADDVVAPSRAFLTAVAATALNPLTIALWTVSFPAAAPDEAARSAAAAGALLFGVGLGAVTWYAGFATAVAMSRERVGDRLLRLVDLAVGSGLVVFGSVLGYRAIHSEPGSPS